MRSSSIVTIHSEAENNPRNSCCCCCNVCGCLRLDFMSSEIGIIKILEVETVFNTVAAFSYIFACSYLGYVVHKYLPPSELLQSMVRVYPAYILSSFIALIYGLEAWKSWIIYRKFN